MGVETGIERRDETRRDETKRGLVPTDDGPSSVQIVGLGGGDASSRPTGYALIIGQLSIAAPRYSRTEPPIV